MDVELISSISHKDLLEAIKIVDSFLLYLENSLKEVDNDDN